MLEFGLLGYGQKDRPSTESKTEMETYVFYGTMPSFYPGCLSTSWPLATH